MAIALGFAVFLASALGGASGRTALDKDAARTLVQQGDQRMAANDYRGALKAYRGADDIMGVPTTSIEVGRVELLLQNLVGALVAFERAAAYPQRQGEPRPFTRARKEAQVKVRELSQRIALLGIEVSGVDDVAALSVAIDDEPVAYPLAQPLRFNPQLYVVSAEAPGYERASETVELSEGVRHTVRLVLRPAPVGGVETEKGPWRTLTYAGFSVAGSEPPALREAWKRFIAADDIVVAWNQSVLDALDAAVELPKRRVHLKSAYCSHDKHMRGPLSQLIQRLQLTPHSCAQLRGRAGRHVADVVALLTHMQN